MLEQQGGKVQLFWEGHKNWRNLHCRFDAYFIMSNGRWRFHQSLWLFLKIWNLTTIGCKAFLKSHRNSSKPMMFSKKIFFDKGGFKSNDTRYFLCCQIKYSWSLSWAENLIKLFTFLGGKFKFSAQDSDLEYLCWQCKNSPVPSD